MRKGFVYLAADPAGRATARLLLALLHRLYGTDVNHRSAGQLRQRTADRLDADRSVAPSRRSAGSRDSFSSPFGDMTPNDRGCVAPGAMAQSSKVRSLVGVALRQLAYRLPAFGSRHRRRRWIAACARGAMMPRMRPRKSSRSSCSKIQANRLGSHRCGCRPGGFPVRRAPDPWA